MADRYTVVINETKRYDYTDIVISEGDIAMILAEHEERGNESRWPLSASDVNLLRHGAPHRRFKRAAEIIALHLHHVGPMSAQAIRFSDRTINAFKTN